MANQNQYIKPPSKDNNKVINNDDEYIKPPSKREA